MHVYVYVYIIYVYVYVYTYIISNISVLGLKITLANSLLLILISQGLLWDVVVIVIRCKIY